MLSAGCKTELSPISAEVYSDRSMAPFFRLHSNLNCPLNDATHIRNAPVLLVTVLHVFYLKVPCRRIGSYHQLCMSLSLQKLIAYTKTNHHTRYMDMLETLMFP